MLEGKPLFPGKDRKSIISLENIALFMLRRRQSVLYHHRITRHSSGRRHTDHCQREREHVMPDPDL